MRKDVRHTSSLLSPRPTHDCRNPGSPYFGCPTAAVDAAHGNNSTGASRGGDPRRSSQRNIPSHQCDNYTSLLELYFLISLCGYDVRFLCLGVCLSPVTVLLYVSKDVLYDGGN